MITLDSLIGKIAGCVRHVLPHEYERAVVIVAPDGAVGLTHDMDAIKLAIVLGKLTEKLVKEAKQPIFEGVQANGIEQAKV